MNWRILIIFCLLCILCLNYKLVYWTVNYVQ